MEKPISSNNSLKRSYEFVEKFVEEPIIEYVKYDRKPKPTSNPEER